MTDIHTGKGLTRGRKGLAERPAASAGERPAKYDDGIYRTLLESAAEGIVIIDRKGRIVMLNVKAEELFGYRQEELFGQVVETLMPEALREIHRKHRVEYLAAPHNRSMGINLDLVARRRDGSEFPVEIALSHAGKGDGLLIMASVNDISLRKKWEDEIEKLNANLAVRAADLETANLELEAFNYTVAHDLRKPLTLINGYCQAISDLCGDRLDVNCKDYLREIYDGSLQMNRLIDALLDFARMGHVEPRRETVQLGALANETVNNLKQFQPERQVDIRIADAIVAYADAALLRVVLDNLLGNAWKYTGKRERAVIEFGVKSIDGCPVYFVRDNGSGFNMKDADKLFAPFQRLPGAGEFKGFGIGLATVERIIRRHGGRIWAEGEPDKGATFYFILADK
jgi:PAS domain S-box-containing protein